MSTFSPIAAGFRTVAKRPGLLARELAWRWMWGGTALALVWFTFREYLSSLTVTDTDLLLLRSGQPFLVARAIAAIFRGSGERLESALLLEVVASAVLWVVLATLGRGIIARRLRNPQANASFSASALATMLKLQSLRAALFLAFATATYGCGLLLAHLLPEANGLVWFVLYANVFLLLSAAWSFLNWLLSLATLFAGNAGLAGALSLAIDLWRDRRSAIVAAGIVFGLLHFAAIVALNTAFWLPLGFAQVLPAQPVLVAMGFVLLLYCAVVDFLQLARLAAYADMVAQSPEPITAAMQKAA